MRLVTILFLLLASHFVLSQEAILHDPVSSTVFQTSRYAGIKGSPFLIDTWTKGRAHTSKGYYPVLELKLDAFNNVLLFNRNNEPFQFEEDIVSFVLMPSDDSASFKYFKKGYTATGLKPIQYVELLASEPVLLLRSDIRQVSDMNEINQGVIKTFNSITRYYAGSKDKLELIRLNQKDILALFPGQEDKIREYVKLNKLNFRNEKDVAALFNFMNQ